MQVMEPKVRRWTRAEYERLAEQGWFDGQRVELIDGEILEMPPQKNWHVVAIKLMEDALNAAFGSGYWVRVQAPLILGTFSEPEPDLAVVLGQPRDFTDHPTTALLVVEVSETTLAYDRRRKASLYAQAGIADYWIVNLMDRQLEVLRNPQPDPAEPFGFGYADHQISTAGQSVAPLALPAMSIPVADVLP